MTIADDRPRLWVQVEATFSLWRASVRAVYPFALLYALAGCLPAFFMGDLHRRVLVTLRDFALFALNPNAVPALDPSALTDALVAWFGLPSSWLVLGGSALLGLTGITALMIRQHDIALQRDRGFATTARTALARLPAALAAWAGYLALMLVAMLPIGALAWAVWALVADSGLAGLLLLLLAFVAGSALLSIPLVWASVAFALAPVAATLAGTGPVAAQIVSARRVRGHWMRTATLLTLPMLIYLGAASTVSSVATPIAAGIAYALGGTAAVLAGEWMSWMQLACAVPMAALLPLAFAGMVVAWEDGKASSEIQPSG